MTHPDFRSPAFLRDHMAAMIGFYHPRCVDPRGGYFQFYQLDGAIHTPDAKDLVSSARMVVSYAMALGTLGTPGFDAALRHGVAFLRENHRQAKHGGYAWALQWRDGCWQASDASNQCYGFAFVALAFSHALSAGVLDARADLEAVYDLMEAHFWDPAGGLYVEELAEDWMPLSQYRSQNANMHACEAFLAAHEATGDAKYLERALLIARNLCVVQAEKTRGLVWEHYDRHWQPDFKYNFHDYSNIYRPWGYQVGHQTEWAKFLVHLHQRTGEKWLPGKAVSLFDRMLALGWDHQYGGFAYSIDDRLVPCNFEKYFWTQNETACSAAIMAHATGVEGYMDWHDRIWALCWDKLVDHKHGSWDRLFSRDWQLIAADKGPGGKDYHVIGACFDLLRLHKPAAG